MKKYFITGLIILLPLTLTVGIVLWFFNLLTDPFAGAIRYLFNHYGLLEKGFFFLNASQVQLVLSKLIILAFLFFFTLLLGTLARLFFFNYLMNWWNKLIHRIPLVRSIYKTSQDVINTIFASNTNSFKQVVMVPFPNTATYTIGLVTRDDLPSFEPNSETKRVAVFVPTTPNPTSGFLVLFKDKDLIYLDMPIENAFKYIISCGVIATAFKNISKEEALLLAEKGLQKGTA
ncbi:MAG TPA: DUF502 domain-containing protein [Parachlamydiaceae bacterium]|nr:DUF502 domain-containing protein [Parachlamydiaceae bacterium]